MKRLSSSPPVKQSFLEKIRPTNLEQEKQKFLFDPNYNPQFEYAERIDAQKLLRHGDVSEEYITAAVRILDTVLAQYGGESNYLTSEKGEKLNREQSVAVIQDFLRQNRLEDMIHLSFSRHYSARTSLKRIGTNFVLQLRTPVEYREKSLQGMLHHEIGTHFFRWMNEMEQPWFQYRSDFGLHRDYLVTEEGLAVLNNKLAQDRPYLWSQALNYFLVYEGARSSFAELNRKLKKYVDDPQRRWAYCFKVKRGVEDTATDLVFSKSQIYFQGAILVLRWLVKNDYEVDQLYLGKVSLSDLPTAQKKATHSPVLPAFLHSRQFFVEKINEIIDINKLGDIV